MHTISLKVRLILVKDNKILLLRQTKSNGGNYTLVGGGIESYEFATQSLIRESEEEAGIILRKKDLSIAHVLHKKTNVGERITLYFEAKHWKGNIASKEPEKFKSVKWYELNKLPSNLTNTVRHVLLEYKKGSKYSEFRK